MKSLPNKNNLKIGLLIASFKFLEITQKLKQNTKKRVHYKKNLEERLSKLSKNNFLKNRG